MRTQTCINKILPVILAGSLFLVAFTGTAAAQAKINHDLQVRLEPQKHLLMAKDRIAVVNHKQRRIVFDLADHLEIHSVLVNAKSADYTFKRGRLSIEMPGARQDHELQIEYSGVFDDQAPHQPLNTDNPGFGVTGSIGSRGTLLLAGANWYPYNRQATSYTLSVDAPEGISAVTAGTNLGHRTRGGRTVSRWQIEQPLRGLSLAAGAYQPETRTFGRITAATYFTPVLETLSQDYLKATGKYLALYENLFGPYAFKQFSIVENFFPTGYGFPSYTLLGRRVLQLPFIIHTSLGHEIAHCWWGNGVLVDASLGNWSEGLTSYVADYYYKEQRGKEVSHRLQWLRNYTSLVPRQQEVALTGFMSRSDPLSKAIGYDKAAMVFHMLRRKVGDDLFWRTLRDVYARYLFQAITWRHWQEAFEQSAGTPLDDFFQQWVYGSGAPQLSLSDTRIVSKAAEYVVHGTLAQRKPYFKFDVDLVLTTDTKEIRHNVSLSADRARFSITSAGRPLSLEVDPQVHLFRRLSPQELPPTVNSIKGAEALTVVVSRGLGKGWTEIAKKLCIALGIDDADVVHESKLPSNWAPDTHIVWIGLPGADSRMPDTGERFTSDAQQFKVLDQAYPRQEASFFGLFENNRKPGRVIAVFLPADLDTAARVCAKIPHYGKYSYLIFKDQRNLAKGTWPVDNSPVVVHWEAGALPSATRGEL